MRAWVVINAGANLQISAGVALFVDAKREYSAESSGQTGQAGFHLSF